MATLKPIQRLPSEVLDRVLVLLVAGGERPTAAGHKDVMASDIGQLSSPLTRENLTAITNFRLVEKRFDKIYRLRFYPMPPILRLSNEILDNILEYLVHDSGRLITIDHRASLSVESFQSSPPQSTEDSNGTGNFRLTCKRFAKLGINRQFARVSVRFSLAGFERLAWVARQPHLAKEVKKFSYIVPIFYPQGRERFVELLNQTHRTTIDIEAQIQQRQSNSGANQIDRLRPTNHQLRTRLGRSKDDEKQIIETMTRAENQRRIKEENIDVQGLLFALKVFTYLQQIRLMRVQDAVDAGWANFLRNHPALAAEFRPSEWTLACEHATRTLGGAFLASNSPANRLSSRFMDPQTPLLLTHSSQTTISTLAMRLTCLELQFNDPTNLDDKMLQLSGLFQTLFSAAVNIQGLHIGFPMQRPVSIPLEAVFHNVQWEKLRYIGFGAWRLSSGEIIDLIRRHRKTLRSVRLRGVLLNEGSRWVEVLRVLRLELKLKWVSLRGVGYTSWAGGDAIVGVAFVPIMHIQPESDSSDGSNWGDPQERASEVLEDDDEEETSSNADLSDAEATVEDDHGDGFEESADGSDAGDSDLGPAVHDNSIDDQTMLHHSSTASDNPIDGSIMLSSSATAQMCECDNGYSLEDLEDEGEEVTKGRWKMWEKWAIQRCSMHDGKTTSAY